MSKYTDQLGDVVEFEVTPKRIISLVPSQTELLYDLGLEEEVIGITKFCIHPQQWFKHKTRVGGTKTVNIETIRAMKPDLIIANKEENIKEQVAELKSVAPVWVSDVNNLEEALSMINSIGGITGRTAQSNELIRNVREKFNSLPAISDPVPAAYLIWKDPYMTIGGDTFITDLLQKAGFTNVFSPLRRYPEVTLDQLQQSHCKVILLSSEPYPFKQKHIIELQQYIPGKKIILVDGEMFSWYGSRLLHSPGYFLQLMKTVK